MTKSKAHIIQSIALLSASLFFCNTAPAAVVYNNSANLNLLNRSFSPGGGQEFGDQVFLSGAERRITDFQFEYYLSPTASGNETAELSFYRNDGGTTGTTPGTKVYSSGEFSLDKGFQSVIAQALSITVPSTFTWAVKFGGIDIGEQAGLLLANPPTVGASIDDFWVRSSDGSWSTFLVDAGATPANFSARINAVPEPGTFLLAMLGGLALLGYRRGRNN